MYSEVSCNLLKSKVTLTLFRLATEIKTSEQNMTRRWFQDRY